MEITVIVERGMNLNFLTSKAHLKSVFCIVFSPDGERLASSSADKTIKIWNTKDLQAIKTLHVSFFY